MFKKKLKLNKHNDITFVARNEFILKSSEAPQPAKDFIPKWYKDIPPFHSKTPHFDNNFGNNNSTMKQCMPFFDSFNMGYIMVTPCDIVVEKNHIGDNVKVSANNMFDIIGERGPSKKHSMPIPDTFYDFEWTWQTHFEAQTPKGYSCLYTHPLNRPDLPWYTLSGVMDTDHWWITGNHPFFIKKGFEGIIPMGTPMMQVIPFKREDWKQTKPRSMDPMEHDIIQSKVRRHSSMGYKKEMWTRKIFI
jgi:hypothetical protein